MLHAAGTRRWHPTTDADGFLDEVKLFVEGIDQTDVTTLLLGLAVLATLLILPRLMTRLRPSSSPSSVRPRSRRRWAWRRKASRRSARFRRASRRRASGEKPPSVLAMARQQLRDPMNILLAAVVSFVIGEASTGIIALLVLFNVVLESRQELKPGKRRRAVEAARAAGISSRGHGERIVRDEDLADC